MTNLFVHAPPPTTLQIIIIFIEFVFEETIILLLKMAATEIVSGVAHALPKET